MGVKKPYTRAYSITIFFKEKNHSTTSQDASTKTVQILALYQETKCGVDLEKIKKMSKV